MKTTILLAAVVVFATVHDSSAQYDIASTVTAVMHAGFMTIVISWAIMLVRRVHTCAYMSKRACWL